MSSDVPDWVRSDCRLWGRQKRRIWEGKDWHGNIDGYANSLIGRIREERDGASQGIPSQKWPEVFWGAGLDVQRALIGMPEMPQAVLNLHYVFPSEIATKAREKAKILGIAERAYWSELGRAEFWLFARLTKPIGMPQNSEAEAVSVVVVEPKKRSLSSLNLESLNRPRLTVKSAQS